MFKSILFFFCFYHAFSQNFSFPKPENPYPAYLIALQEAPKQCPQENAFLTVTSSDQNFFGVNEYDNTYQVPLMCLQEEGQEITLPEGGNFYINLQKACASICGNSTCLFNTSMYKENTKSVFLTCLS